MKTLILLLLFPVLGFAQNALSDTTYVFEKDKVYFKLSRVVYDDGSYVEKTEYLGDLDAISNYYERQFSSEANNLARITEQLIQADRILNKIIREDTEVANLYGISPMLNLQQEQDSFFIFGQWVISDNGVESGIVFDRNATGKLRVRINNTVRTVHYFGDAIRIVNYPTSGAFLNFYKVNATTWFEPNRKVFIRNNFR